MVGTHYFQVVGPRYEDNPLVVGTPGVAFLYLITPDGQVEVAFGTKVVFTLQLLTALRRHPLGRPFLRREDKSKFSRFAFHRLREQLESNNLSPQDRIDIDHTQAGQVDLNLPKECEWRVADNEKLFCWGDSAGSSPIETSAALCEECAVPALLSRCDNLRLVKASRSQGTQGRLRIVASCGCIQGNALPDKLEDCQDLNCFVCYKFHLQPPKPPIGFKLPR